MNEHICLTTTAWGQVLSFYKSFGLPYAGVNSEPYLPKPSQMAKFFHFINLRPTLCVINSEAYLPKQSQMACPKIYRLYRKLLVAE